MIKVYFTQFLSWHPVMCYWLMVSAPLYCVCVPTYLQLGIGYFDKDYTGGPLLSATSLYYCMKQLVLHPFTPLFVRGSTFSYMSYSVGRLHALSLWHLFCMH